MPLRLTGWDYSANGAYFVTVCTYARQPALASISVEGLVQLSPMGSLLAAQLVDAVHDRPGMSLDAWVIMPDHVQVIVIVDREIREQSSVSVMVARMKAGVTRTSRKMGIAASGGILWQRGFFDRVIRNDQELDRLREYIATNPSRWLARGSVGQVRRLHDGGRSGKV